MIQFMERFRARGVVGFQRAATSLVGRIHSYRGSAMKTANFYLNFPGNTEEAFNFYKSIFGVEIMMLVRFADFPDSMGVSEQDRNKIAHIAIPLGAGNILMGTDVVQSHGRPFSMGSNFYISLEADTDAEAHRLFDALSEGGRVEMELQKTEWAEKYGSLVDRFGVQWMVSYTGNVQFSLG
jgi:PhnB protein